jgi:hypothetical protein
MPTSDVDADLLAVSVGVVASAADQLPPAARGRKRESMK